MKYTRLLIGILVLISCQTQGNTDNNKTTSIVREKAFQDYEVATFAGGCFWCIEASFEQIEGVKEAISGYAGGSKNNADYKKVSSGYTKHAEAVQVYYDPEVISYEILLDIFFTAHGPNASE